MPTDDESREQGIEFGPLADELENEAYPMSNAELIEKYGDREIDLENGGQTLEEALDPLGETTFDSAEDVRQSITGMMSDEAVGREDYSDRGGTTPQDDREEESL